MVSRVYSAQTVGIEPQLVTVEVDMGRGLHSFSIIGLPDRAIEEAKDRINAAIKNSGYKPPQKGNKRVVIALAPADLKKEGPIFDCAMALGALKAAGDIQFNEEGKLFLGELALNGDLRPIKGALPIARYAKLLGFKELYLPKQNAQEAALIGGITIYGVSTLKELIEHINTDKDAEQITLTKQSQTKIKIGEPTQSFIDFSDVKGQETAKRGLEIAAAGGHNVGMYGPPGTGKTLLAKAFSGILPALTLDEVIEVTGIHSAAGALKKDGAITDPPFKSPHHTASYVSLVGGGTYPRPGEITLAHRGVLFLDEFPEFEKRVIDSLRQPLEDKIVNISRAKDSVRFPADFILLAAMNLCPCGNTGLTKKECVCNPAALLRYKRKISGPIIDRIDLWLSVPEIDIEKLSDDTKGEPSHAVRSRIESARLLQKSLFKKHNLSLSANSQIGPKEIKKVAPLNTKELGLLNESAKKLGLSARSYHKVIKVAQTIAALDGKERIETPHLLEALQYRPKNLSL
ncbi:magnesium chelatase [bacterium]|mgnify:CR=1 FL=1|nr:magnesium chelatase [bacterium]|tara:strand:+ start:208 stop:1755 length:1548 start_codon:yes stop_codon:yes gene_type:complete